MSTIIAFALGMTMGVIVALIVTVLLMEDRK